MSKVEKAIQKLRKIEAYVEGQRRSEVTLACDVVLAELDRLRAELMLRQEDAAAAINREGAHGQQRLRDLARIAELEAERPDIMMVGNDSGLSEAIEYLQGKAKRIVAPQLVSPEHLRAVLAELEQLTAIAGEMAKASWDAPMAHEMAKAWKEGTSNE